MALDFYGRNRVLFSTGFPWWKPERAVEFVSSVLDEDERRQVMSTNAKALFGR
jgi:predicted TIM-barrel fold metal-dependent hydrolase